MTACAPRPRHLGPYEIHGELGRGGSGIVFLGRRTGTSELFAVKTLLTSRAVDPALERAMLDEARLSGLVRHRHVVSTVDVVANDGELVLVMPYVHGVTLASLLRVCVQRSQACPVEIAARIVHDLLLGLHAAHEACDDEGKRLDLVHRDVSPQNVIVAEDGTTRLIDFGIAKAKGCAELTLTGELKGKAPYLAPETLEGETATRLTDVYAAAVVLWEALCGRRLFRASAIATTWEQILKGDVPRPSAIVGRPVSLDAIVMRALSRDPGRRPRSALAMAQEIARVTRLAPRRRVSEWVRWAVGEELDRRAQVCADVAGTTPLLLGSRAAAEAFPPAETPPEPIAVPVLASRRFARLRSFALLAAAMLVLLLVAGLAMARPHAPAPGAWLRAARTAVVPTG